MVEVLSDAYWTTQFAITQADLDRLAAFIDSSGHAQHLSTLAKRMVNGRLRHGHEQSAPINQLFDTLTTVKLWDPAGQWQTGDHVIVLRKVTGRLVAHIGEVQTVNLVKNQVDVFIPEENLVNKYGLLSENDPTRLSVIANVQHVVTRKREQRASQSANEAQSETIEIIMLEHGERIAGLLLQALRDDDRFVLLDGRYFLRSLSLLPPEPYLRQLAWSLLLEPDPLPTQNLLVRIPAVANGDAALFGLYLALRQHPESFANTQPGKRPLWALAGPPPGSFTPQHAAYDPDSYEILCLPCIEAPPETVSRLWQVELLTAVV